MEDDRVYEAHGFTPSQCSATPYNYSLFKRDGEIHINQKIHFMGEERLKPKLEPCLKQAKSFYSSHGLNYEIEKLSSSDEADFSVQLIPGEGRSNAVEWYEGDIVNCSVVIHEIGHLLGLPDEYHEEFTCREEKFSALEFNPFSFMEYSSSQTLVNLFLLPRHMLAILDQAIPSTLSFIVPESGTIGSKLPSCQSVSQVGESDFFFNFTYEPLSLYRAEVGFCRT